MEWKNNDNLTPKDFAIIHDPTDLPVSPIIELSKDILRRIDNTCLEFCNEYGIGIADWQENARKITRTEPCSYQNYFPLETAEIMYKDISVCAYGPDPVKQNCFLLSESWKIHKDYNDLILKGAKPELDNIFNDNNKPFIFRGGL